LIIFPEWRANSANEDPLASDEARSRASSTELLALWKTTAALEKFSYSTLLTS